MVELIGKTLGLVDADASCEIKHQGGGVLRDRVGAINGDVGDDDATFPSDLEVDCLICCSETVDITHNIKLAEDVAGQRGLVGEEVCLACGPFKHLIVRRSVVGHLFAEGGEGLPADVARVQRITGQYCDLLGHLHAPRSVGGCRVASHRTIRR